MKTMRKKSRPALLAATTVILIVSAVLVFIVAFSAKTTDIGIPFILGGISLFMAALFANDARKDAKLKAKEGRTVRATQIIRTLRDIRALRKDEN